jgi:pyruvate/2-oxoglutarate dehydrogenase complex dihydrolipoamide dehydrogenase (E3) component
MLASNMKNKVKNNMTKIPYDIIVIGAGSAGLNIASFFARIKLRVLLVDKSDCHIGGDCLNSGCVPSKALLHVAAQIQQSKLADRFYASNNIQTEKRQVNIQAVTDLIRSKQDYIRASENPEYLKQKGIEYISGNAEFINKNTIKIGDVEYSAKHFVLATGSRARLLDIPNDSSIPVFTNETIFSIDYLPRDFVFVGGGPINCELGQAFSRLGSKVTILNSASRILEKELPEVSALLQTSLEQEGVTIINNVVVETIENKSLRYSVSGGTQKITADGVFVGIGRVLNIENLGFAAAGVKVNESKTKLVVDKYLRTTNKHIYVAGDVAGNYQFTHAAEMHAKTVISNILSPRKNAFDAANISWVTFTSPEIATFGLARNVAQERGYTIETVMLQHSDRAIVDETQNGFVSVYIDKKGYVRGGTAVCSLAGEIVQELVLAMSARVPVSTLFEKVYAYPVATRINKQLISQNMAKKLTNTNIWLLKALYKIKNL